MQPLPKSTALDKQLYEINLSSGDTYPLTQEYEVVSFSELLKHPVYEAELWNQQQTMAEQIYSNKQEFNKAQNKLVDENQVKAREKRKNKQMSQAIEFLRLALWNYKEFWGVKSKKVLETYYKLGSYYLENKDGKNASTNMKQCLILMREFGIQKSFQGIKVKQRLGQARRFFDIPSALRCFNQAEKLCKQIGLKCTIYHSNIFINMGQIHFEVCEYKKAQLYFWSSLMILVTLRKMKPSDSKNIREDFKQDAYILIDKYKKVVKKNSLNRQLLKEIKKDIQLILKSLNDKFGFKIPVNSLDLGMEKMKLEEQDYSKTTEKEYDVSLQDRLKVIKVLRYIAVIKMESKRFPEGLILLKIVKEFMQSEQSLKKSQFYGVVMQDCRIYEQKGFDLSISLKNQSDSQEKTQEE